MDIRITVTYPATDGTMPESVDVVFDGAEPEQVRPLLAPILEVLLTAPALRHTEPDRLVRINLTSDDKCQRVTCGHPRSQHRTHTAAGAEVLGDPFGGLCRICDNPAQCRSFVGKSSDKEASR